MDHLVDTNVLLRSMQRRSPSYRQARSAVVTLLRREERLCIFPQNVIEFWSVARARHKATDWDSGCSRQSGMSPAWSLFSG